MTKYKPRQKTDRKTIRKRRNEKYDFIYLEESEIDYIKNEETKSRVPSKQQYLRLKKKTFIQNHCKIGKIENFFSDTKKKINFQENLIILDSCDSCPKSASSLDNETTSSFSFHIHPDWSDFEDIDHVQFVSEQDFDMSNVLKVLDEHQPFDFDTFEDVSFSFDLTDNSLSNWAAELSTDGLQQATASINQVEKIITENYQFLFEIDHDFTIWADAIREINNILVMCESNKNLLQNLLMKDHSFELQDRSFKWINLSSKGFSIKCFLEIIRDLEIVRRNFHIAFEILHDQCLTLLDHGIVYSRRLIIQLIDNIKRIILALKDQHRRIELSLSEIFTEYKQYNVTMLNKMEEEINCVEQETLNNGKCINQLDSIKDILRKYLGREKEGISCQQPVLNFCF